MTMSSTNTMSTPQPLGDGLVLRWSTAADTEKIAALTAHVFRDNADDPLNVRMADQMRIVMREDHPYMDPTDFAVVEDTNQPERPLVACTCLWQHTWSYGGIPFPVGRPEFVATDPAYRRRGLVRHIFNYLHARSDARGDLMQGITGIPYFYRQFGYGMLLDLGGRSTALLDRIPQKKEDEAEQCTLQPATVADVPLLQLFHDNNRKSSLMWHEANEDYWHYLVSFWDDPANQRADRTMVGINVHPQMLVDPAGEVIGMVVVGHHRWGRELGVYELAINTKTNLQAIVPSLLRALRNYGETAPTFEDTDPPLSQISFRLGREHPLYTLIVPEIAPKVEDPYAWYIRMPNIPAFLRLVTPVLEERLAQSMLHGYSGELCINLYRDGVKLVFKGGRLTSADPWRVLDYEDDKADAGIPPLVFPELLLGYRSLEELRIIHPDVHVKTRARLLLETLFPKRPSHLMPMG